MNKKLIISLCFLLLTAIFSGYCLWQIDRHEKALLGREWLNPVPVAIWHKYLREKEEFDKLAKSYIANHPDIVSLIEEYRNRQQDIMPVNPKIDWSNPNFINSMLENILEEIRFNSNIPDQLSLAKSKQKYFQQEHPSEFNTWRAMIDDLNKHNYETPYPSNPPTPVIRQSISSYYRYMMIGDAILILGLITFLLTYKEKAVNPPM
jgi:hypothetical protein